MTIRIVAIAALLFAAAPASASGQGSSPRQVVVSPTALKAMTSQKPKSKKPLAARAGVVLRPTKGVPSRSSAPTSVREILPKERK